MNPCFFGHKWGKWKVFYKKMENINWFDNKSYIYDKKYQERECLLCGYYQEEEIE